MTFAAGLACDGMRPVVAIYSTFLQRAYDQLIHDVALQNLPVVFALDRGGLVGADGATHHGAFDLSYLRCIPNLVVMAPSDENECRQMLHTALMCDAPAAVRYPRGTGPGVPLEQEIKALPIGRGEIRRTGKARAGHRIALLAFGSMVAPALAVAEEFNATVANMRFVRKSRCCQSAAARFVAPARRAPAIASHCLRSVQWLRRHWPRPRSSMPPWRTCASSSRWT